MERKFNNYGKPLPNKTDLEFLKSIDFIVKNRLVSYIETELEDSLPDISLSSYLDQFDVEELSKMILDDIGEFKLRDKENVPLYYIFLKNTMIYFFKDANYPSLKNDFEGGSWKQGWIPDLVKNIGTDFEESYAFTLLWLNSELKKFGTSIPEIESSINESELKNFIKKILNEQSSYKSNSFSRQSLKDLVKGISKSEINVNREICSTLTCNKLGQVLGKIDFNKLDVSRKKRVEELISKYQRDVRNNSKDSPLSGGLKGATGDSEKDFCDQYLSEIQSLICEPRQE